MKLFRLCCEKEIEYILNNCTLQGLGNFFENDNKRNTHKYIENKRYIHSFDNIINVLFLNPPKENYICVYDIPDDITNDNKKTGYYLDFINFNYKCNVVEYAINSEKIKYEYLDKIYFVSDDLDFDYYPYVNEIYSCLTLKYDFEKQKKLKLIKNKFK